MKELKKLFFTLAVVIGFTAPTVVTATDFSCSPIEVAVYAHKASSAYLDRIHVRCSAPAMDGKDSIWFWAVSTSDAQEANRFLSTASTALVAGRKLKFSFDPGDTRGASFGCLAHDCRIPWAIVIY